MSSLKAIPIALHSSKSPNSMWKLQTFEINHIFPDPKVVPNKKVLLTFYTLPWHILSLWLPQNFCNKTDHTMKKGQEVLCQKTVTIYLCLEPLIPLERCTNLVPQLILLKVPVWVIYDGRQCSIIWIVWTAVQSYLYNKRSNLLFAFYVAYHLLMFLTSKACHILFTLWFQIQDTAKKSNMAQKE